MTIEISTEMQIMTLAPTDNKSFFGSTSRRQLTQTQPSTHLWNPITKVLGLAV